MRVSDYFKLGRSQESLDFVDVELTGDAPLFLDPNAFLNIDSEWGARCRFLIQDFFREVLKSIRAGDNARAARSVQ